MKELYDAVNCAVIMRWPSIRPEHEKVGGEHLAMYMFTGSNEFDFVINLISKRSLTVFCWKRKGRSARSQDFKFLLRDNMPYHIKADGSHRLDNYDLTGQAKYIVDGIANFFTPPAEPA